LEAIATPSLATLLTQQPSSCAWRRRKRAAVVAGIGGSCLVEIELHAAAVPINCAVSSLQTESGHLTPRTHNYLHASMWSTPFWLLSVRLSGRSRKA